ncbi:MAG: hypothetical protein K2P67_01615 [Gallionellaceae bacterium]|nr:hypothetical protein [Gallionellaceae bacterium]
MIHIETSENMNPISQSLQVHCNNKETVVSGQVEFYTTGGAALQGIKMFVLTLLGAILSIVLPGLHFITVPLGILASPFIGFYFFRTRKGAVKRITGDFLCPECQASNYMAFRAAPYYFGNCVQCQHEFQVIPLQPHSLPANSNSTNPTAYQQN